MSYIDLKSLYDRLDLLKADFQSKKPFRYVMFENFFPDDDAQLIYENYPQISNDSWDGTTYIDQKNKFQKAKFDKGSVMEAVFSEFNSPEFLEWLEQLTGIEEKLIADEELFGAGLHQSINGAFLNVHVDFNIHPKTGYHRRLNVMVYMNKEWKDEYEGHIELWDMTGGNKKQLGKFAPSFNRCIIFETNEISFHGHPKPLTTPKGINRKSLATYYYTKARPENEITSSHNTIYVNTEGLSEQVKRFKSGVKALLERISRK